MRLPLAPLLELATPSIGHHSRGSYEVRPHGRPARITSLARALGCTRRTVHRWAHQGLTVDAADRAAVALGRHPCEVWGDDWFRGALYDDDGWDEVEAAHRQWIAQHERRIAWA